VDGNPKSPAEGSASGKYNKSNIMERIFKKFEKDGIEMSII
jgi:hypothetical protein